MYLDPNRDFNEQMRETAILWNKCQDSNSRKQYHLKLSFHPQDAQSGKLTEDDAMDIGTAIVKEFFPTAESVLSVHVDKEHLHVHAVINAVDLTGKMINMRSAQYRALKDRVQQVCSERGLSAIDWRAATKSKREKERIDGPAVRESFAEQRMHQEGKIPIKTRLRSIINQAIMSASSFEEFQENLKQQDVILTRATSNTISYKLSNFRPYRGDTLGSDFTMLAIHNRLAYNQKNGGINKRIKEAEAKAAHRHLLTEEEKLTIHNYGQYLGLQREEVEQLFEAATSLNRKVVSKAWDYWKITKAQFWESYRTSQQEISSHLDDLYHARRILQQAEWLLHPSNTRKSLWGVLFAMILRLSTHTSLTEIEAEIAYYKAARVRLQHDVLTFKAASEKGIQNLKSSDFQLNEFLNAISRMHASADLAFCAVLDIPLERQYVITEDYRIISKADLLKQQENLIKERS